MANEQNLRPDAHKLTAEEQSAGGKKSGASRRDKRRVREILETFLSTKAGDNKILADIADQYGLQREESVKAVFTAVCLIRSAAEGDIASVERLAKLLEEYEPRTAIDLNVTPFEDL